MKNKSIQLPEKLHKSLSRDLIRNDGIKTYGSLIGYYRRLAGLYLKELKVKETKSFGGHSEKEIEDAQDIKQEMKKGIKQ